MQIRPHRLRGGGCRPHRCNGDVANKIGTYSVAVLAKENNVPFYVAAPISTLDLTIASGDSIPIEQRFRVGSPLMSSDIRWRPRATAVENRLSM